MGFWPYGWLVSDTLNVSDLDMFSNTEKISVSRTQSKFVNDPQKPMKNSRIEVSKFEGCYYDFNSFC